MSKAANRGFHVLIPAAGTGVRAGGDLPKQYHDIGGKTVLRHTIEKFLGLDGLLSLHVIIDPSHQDFYLKAVNGLDLPPPVMGAATRKGSVAKGLAALSGIDDDALVMIHDAARPFMDAQAIDRLVTAMNGHDAATLATPIADTLVDADYSIHDRERLKAVQTPQAFRLGILRAVHERFAGNDAFTDDAGLVAASGHTIALVEGSRSNFKITTKEDLAMADKLLGENREYRTGFGFDIHRFADEPAASTRLGGIDVPSDRRLDGHSDADVVLHALTDALLGTIGDGDIGQIFPPSDMQWKGADSAVFIAEAIRRVHAKGGRIVHSDVSLIAETPKIGPHRAAMQERLAAILGLAPDRVGLKATTAEKLGSLGRGEGIAAQAVVTVSFALL